MAFWKVFLLNLLTGAAKIYCAVFPPPRDLAPLSLAGKHNLYACPLTCYLRACRLATSQEMHRILLVGRSEGLLSCLGFIAMHAHNTGRARSGAHLNSLKWARAFEAFHGASPVMGPCGCAVDSLAGFLMRGALACACGLAHNHLLRVSDHSLCFFIRSFKFGLKVHWRILKGKHTERKNGDARCLFSATTGLSFSPMNH